jgi:hypothetical protein
LYDFGKALAILPFFCLYKALVLLVVLVFAFDFGGGL